MAESFSLLVVEVGSGSNRVVGDDVDTVSVSAQIADTENHQSGVTSQGSGVP